MNFSSELTFKCHCTCGKALFDADNRCKNCRRILDEYGRVLRVIALARWNIDVRYYFDDGEMTLNSGISIHPIDLVDHELWPAANAIFRKVTDEAYGGERPRIQAQWM